MLRRLALRASLGVLLLLSTAVAGAMAIPSITVVSPVDDQVVLAGTVNLTGTAAGSDGEWTQTTAGDFEAGDASQVVVNRTGEVTIGRFLYDDFDDGSLDPGRWTVTKEDQGLSVREEGGELRIGGTSTLAGRHNAVVISKDFVSDDVEANFTLLSGSGLSWGAGLGFYQDEQNSINVVMHYDWTWNSIAVACSYQLGGINGEVFNWTFTGDSLPHTFRVRHSSNRVFTYMDGMLVYDMTFVLPNPRIQLHVGTAEQATVHSRFDNLTGSIPEGNYTSAIFDSRSVHPVLTGVAWNGSTPAGTGLTVFVRSGDAAGLDDASPWTEVENGQSSGLPEMKRYLQYRVHLECDDSASPPELRDITFSYFKPVARVEVSVDQKTWYPATGTTDWRAALQVPENAEFVYARVTDVAGDTALSTVRISVDTLPPEGEITINDGDYVTLRPKVNLTLNATDRSGVAKMMVSESPSFSGAAWTGYRQRAAWTLSAGDGLKTVFAIFQDVHGHVSAPVCDTIVLDTTAPAGTVVINDGDSYANSTRVRLGLNAWDIPDVTEMMLGNTEGLAGSEWVPYANSSAWDLIAGNGERTVYALYRNPLGQISALESDSIILDTEPPSAELALNGGAPFTSSTVVSVRLNASDNTGLSSMEMAEGTAPDGASKEPYRAFSYRTLAPFEGGHVLHARVWDVAGNPGGIVSAGIVLDLTPPEVHIMVPAVVDRYRIDVDRGFSDRISGVAFYEIEYRDGDGAWTPWIRTDAENRSAPSNFTGQDGHTYSFRMRAMDNAGNLGPFVAANNTATVNIPAPVVTITGPLANETVRGVLQARGTAFSRNGPTVEQVFVRLDGGEWMAANGTGQWSIDLRTDSLKNGPHRITVRAYDGVKYSAEVDRVFVVRNPGPDLSVWTENNILWILLLVAAVACAAGYVLYRSARKHRGDGGVD